jgi:MFS family permease
MPAMVGMGWLGDRYGARTLMLIASFVISTGTVLLGTIQELWEIYVFYGLFVGSLGNAAFVVLLPVIVTRWFQRRMGLALGIYWAALGAGPMLFAPLFRYLIETRGWEQTFTFVGVVLGAVLLVFSALVRSSPEEKGVCAYGAETAASRERADQTAAVAPVGMREVLRQRPVWLLMGVHLLGCVGHAIILAHVVSMSISRGLSGMQGAAVLSIVAGVSIFSRFAFSVLTERFGGRACLTWAVAGQASAVVILFFANDMWTFYVFAAVFGICYGGEMVGFPIINRQLFGDRAPLSSIYSFEVVGATVGMGVGGWMGGILFDISGTYTSAIVASAFFSYLAVPLALWLPRHQTTAVAAPRPVAVRNPAGVGREA